MADNTQNSAESFGYMGTIIKVDLTSGTIEKVPTETYRPDLWVGGRAMGSYIQWLECPPEAGALDPENVLTFMTGPLSGTMLDGGRTFVQAVAPVGYPDTGSFSRSSFGGSFAPELKFAGYDGIIVKGKSPDPVYLYIKDDIVELRPAKDLWGMDNFAVQHELLLRNDYKGRVASIGPAGENQCFASTILTDDSSVTGISSFGAVMGSKLLKAISVQGTGSVKIADPEGLVDLVRYTQDLATRKLYETDENTPTNSYIGSWLACLPLTDSDLYKEVRDPDGKFELGYTGCYSCPWGGCGYSFRYKDKSRKPLGQLKCTEAIPMSLESLKNGEYVGDAHFRRLTLNERLGFSDCTMWFQGLDGMSLRGFLTEESTGMDWSNFGDPEFTEDLMYQIAYRSTPVGDAIARGWRYFCEDFIGTPEAIYYYRAIRGVRKSPKHNGGGGGGWYIPGAYLVPGILRFATSNLCASDIRCTGAETFLLFGSNDKVLPAGSEKHQALVDANSTTLFGTDQVFKDIQQWSWDSEWNAPFAKWNHQFKAFDDSLIFCYIAMSAMGIYSNYTETNQGDFDIPLKLLKVVTGREFTHEEEEQFGERVYLLERAIKIRQGCTREDDELFDEVYEEYAPENLETSYYQTDTGLTRENYKILLDNWYDAMGFDKETGLPKLSTFEAYGVTEISDRLQNEYGVELPA